MKTILSYFEGNKKKLYLEGTITKGSEVYHLCPVCWVAVDDTTGESETPNLILDIGTEVKKFKTPVDIQELWNQTRDSWNHQAPNSHSWTTTLMKILMYTFKY